MLPIHNLDDELFEDIVENAKKMIGSLTDTWIDTSLSDPGITFIELFAWLKEMQQYYLNQVSIKNKYKYCFFCEIMITLLIIFVASEESE